MGLDGKSVNVARSPWSKKLRILLPVLTFADIGLLIYANSAAGVSILADGNAPLGMLKPHIVNQDNLFSAVDRLAKSHTWFLMILVAVLSGVWPYAKLLSTMFIVWATDRNAMDSKRAKVWLTTLGTFGKWSHADICLMCLNVAAFDIDTPIHKMGPIGTLKVRIFIHLKYGALSLMVAIIVSMWITTWAKHELELHLAAERPQPLAGGGDAAPVLASWKVGLAACASLASGILVVVGSFTPCIHVLRSGFLANLMAPEDRNQYLSVMQIVMSLGNSFEEVALSIIAFSVTFLAPLFEAVWLLLCSISTHLRVPFMSKATRTLGEWCNNFNTIDVFLIVCIVQLFELPRAVEFNVGSECTPFKSMMSNKQLLGIVGLSDASTSECFVLASTLEVGFWLLLVAVLLRSMAWHIVTMMPAVESDSSLQEAKDSKA